MAALHGISPRNGRTSGCPDETKTSVFCPPPPRSPSPQSDALPRVPLRPPDREVFNLRFRLRPSRTDPG